TRTPGGDADLAAYALQRLAVGVEELGGEGTGADAGRVGLDHADHAVDPGGADAGAHADATGDRVGRGDEGIGPVVDVEHRGLGALEEDGLALVEHLVDHQRRVGDHRAQPLGVGEQLLDHRVDLDRAPVEDLGEQLVAGVEGCLHLFAQDLLVEEVGDPDADPVDLVGVGRTDAAAGGADLVLAQEALGDLVDGRVVGGDHVRVGAHHQGRQLDAALDQQVELAEERLGRDDDTVGDHAGRARREDATGEEVGRELLAVDHDRVAGVVAAGRAYDEVDVVGGGGQEVGRLALAFVAPLGAQNHDRGHRSPSRHKETAPGAQGT